MTDLAEKILPAVSQVDLLNATAVDQGEGLVVVQKIQHRHAELFAHDVVQRAVDGGDRRRERSPALEILAAVQLFWSKRGLILKRAGWLGQRRSARAAAGALSDLLT